jgi:proteasome lid subunit RPN8/RPN11
VTDGTVYATRSLVQALLEYARDREPDPVSVALGSRPAGELEPDDGTGVAPNSLPAETGVFDDFTFPGAGGAVNFVFGVDLGRPAGTAQGRFVSHPDGDPDLSSADDLASRVLVAIPPWTLDDVRAYDRNGGQRSLAVVAASTPAVAFDEEAAENL